MALIIRDSFDFYNIVTDVALNFWDSVASNGSFLSDPTTTRFGVGKAYSTTATISSGTQISKSFNNCTTLFITGAHFPNYAIGGTSEAFYWRIYDGPGTVQCTISFNAAGDLKFFRGSETGTLLGTYTAGYLVGVWTHFQFKIVISNTVGEFHVRKNGATVDDYSLTGVNNVSSGVNQMNKVELAKNSLNGPSMALDDVAIYDSTSTGPWNDWVGDIRAVQIMPNADSAVQFSRSAATIQQGNSTSTSTRSLAINLQATMLAFTPTIGGTLANLTVQFNAAATGHVNCAIFDSTGAGGGPGSQLTNGACSVVTNPVINANTFTFATPPTVAPNVTYWLMMISDVAVTLKSTNGSVQQYTQAKTYAAGAFDSPMTLTSISLTPVNVLATINIANNYQLVQELSEDGLTSYVYDSTVNQVDLYASGGLTFTPTSILGVSLRGFAAKSDAGSRSGALTMKSGATTVVGPTLALPTSFQNISMVQDVDPNTATSWTALAVNSLLFGAKVIV